MESYYTGRFLVRVRFLAEQVFAGKPMAVETLQGKVDRVSASWEAGVRFVLEVQETITDAILSHVEQEESLPPNAERFLIELIDPLYTFVNERNVIPVVEPSAVAAAIKWICSNGFFEDDGKLMARLWRGALEEDHETGARELIRLGFLTEEPDPRTGGAIIYRLDLARLVRRSLYGETGGSR